MFIERRCLTARVTITVYPYTTVAGILPMGFDPSLIPTTIGCRVTVVSGRGIISARPVGQHGIGLSPRRRWRGLIILIHVRLRPSVSRAVSGAVAIGIDWVVIRVVIISRRIVVAVWVVTVGIAVIRVAVAKVGIAPIPGITEPPAEPQ